MAAALAQSRAIFRKAIAEYGAPLPTPALLLSDKPSIVMLPFANMNGHPGKYFSGGIFKNIATDVRRPSAYSSSPAARDSPRRVGLEP